MKGNVMKSMKKIVLAVFMLFCLSTTLLLSSCVENINNERERAIARMEQIMPMVRDKDKEALKLLFSEQALNNADNIDADIDAMFEFLQGDIVAWTFDDIGASSQAYKHGKQSLRINSAYKVATNDETYCFFVVDDNLDKISPWNEGLYMLEVMTWADSEIIDVAWQDRGHAGVAITVVNTGEEE